MGYWSDAPQESWMAMGYQTESRAPRIYYVERKRDQTQWKIKVDSNKWRAQGYDGDNFILDIVW